MATRQADDGVLIGEDTDHLGPPLDLVIEVLARVECSLPMPERERHLAEHIIAQPLPGEGVEGGAVWRPG